MLDGEAEPSIRAHLAQCPACTARLLQARQVEHALHQGLSRWDCPTPQQLGDYHLGLVSGTDERTIMRHIAQCSLCSAEIEELRTFLSADTVSQSQPTPVPVRSARPRLGELIARLLPRTATPALRGAAGGPLVAEAEGTTIVLDVQPAAEGWLNLMGQIVADEQDIWTGALLELRSAGTVYSVAEVDDLGGFSCGTIPSGKAEIRITAPSGRTVVVPDIALGG